MCDLEIEYSDVCVSREHKARKEYTCNACGEVIPRGHRYLRTATLYDSRWTTTINCLRCWRMIEEIGKVSKEAVVLTLDCGENWTDNFGELPEHVARLAFVTPEEMQV